MKVICLIVDGFGIGQMPDVPKTRPEDIGANTLLHIAERVDHFQLPFLSSLGLGNLQPARGVRPAGNKAIASYGRLQLKHFGADTYYGHQELMGSIPRKPRKQYMKDIGPLLQAALEARGYQIEPLLANASCLLVNEVAVIADNMETEAGLNINVTANLDQISFEDLVILGEFIRKKVDVTRVIVVGGRGYTKDDMIRHIKRSVDDIVGIDTPGLGVYDENYLVRHLGKGVQLASQAPTIVHEAGYPVVLLGKAADVLGCEGGISVPMVNTQSVFDLIHTNAQKYSDYLIVANIQETDLAGHEQDVHRWGRLLKEIDRETKKLIELVTPDGALLITGDHGNDPTIGHSEHTREMTPLLFFCTNYYPKDIHLRETLADVGATIVDLFGLCQTEAGKSILLDLVRAPNNISG